MTFTTTEGISIEIASKDGQVSLRIRTENGWDAWVILSDNDPRALGAILIELGKK